MSTVKPLMGKALAAFSETDARYIVLEGSVGSGKTIVSVLMWLAHVLHGPPGRLIMVGKTERTVINNVVKPLQAMLGYDRVRLVRGAGTVFICGREVELYGANDDRAADKIQGATLAGAYVDEVVVLPKSFWDMLTGRMRVEGAKIYATCNPGNPEHWMKKTWLNRAKLHIRDDGTRVERHYDPSLDEDDSDVVDLHRFTFLMEDNPHLPPEYVRDQKAAHAGNPAYYARYILGKWVAAEGVIYGAFDRARHVIDRADLPTMTRTISAGADYGMNGNTRGLILEIGPSPLDGQPALFLSHAWSPSSKRGAREATSEEQALDYAEWARNRPAPRYLYADPAAKDFRAALAKHGIRNVHKADNSVVPGIRTIASLFAADRLFVVGDAKELIAELATYVWDAKAAEKGEDKPVKVNDHAVDAMRYAIYSARHLWQSAIPVTAAAPDEQDEEAA